MVGDIFTDIIKTATLTIIWSKGLKAFGKKDYGEIIKLSGMSICGIDVIKLVAYWRKNPPAIIRMIKGITNFFEKIDNGTGKIMDGIGKFNESIKFLIDRGIIK
ncbi:hypothetical protein G8S49_06375 [Clostridium botulinum C]|uniref:Uncharacterized protein n=2 Tax=Clostridium botulinum TaxID=1491 RepID=A0A9Q4TP18_CLOBO|nr:hypothetical protein [Clostridium botulinum]YP_398627.1 hypothetical protein CST197 [Clostridium phage c-st]MCD3196078.1 hypothetical protein [Clostridium botulinum C]MCD3200318.1 hypothetical protein [Clostridium botulinum C]MCD3206934.1 hypothetical protein [Clostridium botulinum C]MCD3207550.1 hypothetical protein [Clostridium botulinum C]MCD3226284.1 hypothetical protein [Clostridium botulinum C]